MGCDIHLYVEVKNSEGKWVTADRWSPDKYSEDSRMEVEFNNRYYVDRNYDLFAILADVRNGVAFAGIKTGEGFNPICGPRGIPHDCCPEYRSEVNSWDSDGHSHSWHTVADLMDYDWTQESCLQGFLSSYQYKEYARRKSHGYTPESYCGMVEGHGVKYVSNEEMCKLLQEEGQDTGKLQGTYTLCEWTEPYHARAASFLSNTLPRLWRLGKPEDVRIVFFFDN